MNSFQDVWKNVCSYCKSNMNEVVYNTWIDSLEPVKMDGSVAVIRSKSDYQKDIVETHYLPLIQKGFEEIFGFPIEISVITGEPAPV